LDVLEEDMVEVTLVDVMEDVAVAVDTEDLSTRRTT